MTNYRHEIKYVISSKQANILERKLALLLTKDEHGDNGVYNIKSLYFDDLNNTSYYEKLDGVLYREKFRIRIYDDSDKFIRLEKKVKNNDLCMKKQTLISRDIYSKILDDSICLSDVDDELLKEFIMKKKHHHLIPSVIVCYDRLAYTYHMANVRITFDRNVSSGRYTKDLFTTDEPLLSARNKKEVILEVKYDEFLPDSIRVLLNSVSTSREAISKFAACRSLK